MTTFVQISNVAKAATKSVVDNSPAILTALGVAGLVSTTVFAVRATPKAVKLIEAERNFRARTEYPSQDDVPWIKLSAMDIVKVAWKPFVPTVLMGVSTATCIIGSSAIHTKRNAAMIAAYTISESAYKQYKEQVIATVGEAKEQNIRDEVAKKQIIANPPSNSEVIITGGGTMLCYEALTGRYFESDVETLRRAENEINKVLIYDNYASLNDFYNKIGLDATALGDEMGWRVENMLELQFSSTLTKDNRPALSIKYSLEPVRNYWKANR